MAAGCEEGIETGEVQSGWRLGGLPAHVGRPLPGDDAPRARAFVIGAVVVQRLATTAAAPGVTCGAGRILPGRVQAAIGPGLEFADKGTEHVLGCSWSEIGDAHPARRLALDLGHYLGQGDALVVGRCFRIAAEVADRLEVHRPYHRHAGQCKVDDCADLTNVDVRNQGRYQHHGEAGVGAAQDGRFLDRQQLGAADAPIRRVADAVELQEHAVEAGVDQRLGVTAFLGDAQAIGIHLHEVEALGTDAADDFGQVVADGRLTSGKLDVYRAAVRA